MASSAITQKLDAGQRFIWKNDTLAVESVKTYGQRSCFSKIVHRNRYDSAKILAALQSLYSKSLSKEEAACLKKNIRITIQQVAKDNVKTQQMGSITRWLFNKHVVDLKPHTQTFETLQSRTLQDKLTAWKDKEFTAISVKLDNLKAQSDLNMALTEIPFIKKHIDTEIAYLKNLKPSHTSAQCVKDLDNALGTCKWFKERLEKECGKRDKKAIKHTKALIKEAKKKPNTKALNKYLDELKAHHKVIKACKDQLGSSLQVSFASLQETEKAIKKCQKSIEAFESKPIYQEEIKEILDKVKQFPSLTPFDAHYQQKATNCIVKARMDLEKIQNTLTATSATYKQIQQERAALDTSKNNLSHLATLHLIAKELTSINTGNVLTLEEFLKRGESFSDLKSMLSHNYSTPNYDLLSCHVEELKKEYALKYDAYQKSFDFDQYVAKVTNHFPQLISEFKSVYPVDADFTKNTENIHKIAKSISLTLDIDVYLSKSYTHHNLYKKLATILEEKKTEVQKELFEPFFQVLSNIKFVDGIDLQAASSNYTILSTAKDQYAYLKVCDPMRVIKKTFKMVRTAIDENISTIFSEKIKEMGVLSSEFIKKFSALDSKEQAELYLKERQETLEKLDAIAAQHKTVPGIANVPVGPYEQKMKAAIDTFTNDTLKTAQHIESDLITYPTFEEHLKTCQELQASADELAKLDKVTNFEECCASMSQLTADLEKRKAIGKISVPKLHTPFAIDALNDLKAQLDCLHLYQQDISEKLDTRMNDLTK